MRGKKAELRQRLEAAGLWERYLRCRESLIEAGMDRKQAESTAGVWFADGNVPPAETEIPAWTSHAIDVAIDADDEEEVAGVISNSKLSGLDSEIAEEYLPLVRAGQGKQADMRTRAEWVLANLLLKLNEIDPASVPDCGAVALLEWARLSPMTRTEFMSKFALKLVPAKAAEEAEKDVADDGRELIELLDEFKRGADPVLLASAEGAVA